MADLPSKRPSVKRKIILTLPKPRCNGRDGGADGSDDGKGVGDDEGDGEGGSEGTSEGVMVGECVGRGVGCLVMVGAGVKVVGAGVVGVAVGTGVGATVGGGVGRRVGRAVGRGVVGTGVGARVGRRVGTGVGARVGKGVGARVGCRVGLRVGVRVGRRVGCRVGRGGMVGRDDGNSEGMSEGKCEGTKVDDDCPGVGTIPKSSETKSQSASQPKSDKSQYSQRTNRCWRLRLDGPQQQQQRQYRHIEIASPIRLSQWTLFHGTCHGRRGAMASGSGCSTPNGNCQATTVNGNRARHGDRNRVSMDDQQRQDLTGLFFALVNGPTDS